jgi:hypothetical protein
VRKRLTSYNGGIIDEELGSKIIGTVHNEIVVVKQLEGVGGSKHLVIGNHGYPGVQLQDFITSRQDLRLIDIGGKMNDLTLEISAVHEIAIDDTNGTNPSCSQVKSHGRTQATSTNYQYPAA